MFPTGRRARQIQRRAAARVGDGSASQAERAAFVPHGSRGRTGTDFSSSEAECSAVIEKSFPKGGAAAHTQGSVIDKEPRHLQCAVYRHGHAVRHTDADTAPELERFSGRNA